MRKLLASVLVLGVVSSVCVAQTKKSSGGRAEIPTKAKSPYLGAISVDAATGKVLFEDNADVTGYPASVQKLMTLLVILDKIQDGSVKTGDLVTVSAKASHIGGSRVYLKEKEQFSVEDMLYALMVQSANDVAVALAEHVAGSTEEFVKLMNEKAKAIGMTHTEFHSVHGLPPAADQEPDLTTARDLSILARDIIIKHPEALKYTATKERGFRDGKFIMRNHDHLLGSLPGCDGMKTGYYTKAGYSIIVTAKRGDRRVIVVVLDSAGSAGKPVDFGKARDAKAEALMNEGFAALGAK